MNVENMMKKSCYFTPKLDDINQVITHFITETGERLTTLIFIRDVGIMENAKIYQKVKDFCKQWREADSTERYELYEDFRNMEDELRSVIEFPPESITPHPVITNISIIHYAENSVATELDIVSKG